MKKILVVLLLLVSPPVYGQDDCPPGHVRNPAITALDHASMLAAFQASHRGIFGVDSACVPGSGVHDCEYYISASNHYGVYGDDQCHAGWSGYWESWLQVGHGDLSLVQTPARFQPSAQPPPVTPPPAPPAIDLSQISAQLMAIAQQEGVLLTELQATHADVKATKDDTNWLVSGVKNVIEWGWKSGAIPAVAGYFGIKLAVKP